jgi:glycine oxidase
MRELAFEIGRPSQTSPFPRPRFPRPVAPIFYNARVKTWDVIIIGGGVIGLTLSIALRKRGIKVLVVERGEPAREASHAAAGMLADCPLEIPVPLQALATASARMYPEFVHEIQDESGVNVDLRDQGTLLVEALDLEPLDMEPLHPSPRRPASSPDSLLPAPLAELEPALGDPNRPARFFAERSVDPRALSTAVLQAARHREVDISSGTSVQQVLAENGRVSGVQAEKTTYHAPVVVNCAGAWAGNLPPVELPIRPVKGQMLALVGPPILRHVIRSPEVYLVPRSDGRTLVGSTLEEAGYDKRTDPDTVRRLHQAAIRLVPGLQQARMLEAWAGLRPGTPDDLPILGMTGAAGYYIAGGHFRDGILLAPVTAHIMAQIIARETPDFDLSAFSAERFRH